jgi:inhibitor of cysteine peptidase
MTIHYLSQKNRGESLRIKKGDSLVFTLPENPTTGYRWKIEVTGDSIQLGPPPNFAAASEAVGGAGTRSITFLAKETGISTVELRLRRGWGPDLPNSTDLTFQVQIDPET